MSGLRQELGLLQGIGLLSTSLLGTGIFAVPAVAASVAGPGALWGWPLLMLLVLPVALTFARLGRHYPSAAGAAHFAGRAFGPRLEKLTTWLFLAVLPVGMPAGLTIAAGFWVPLVGPHPLALLAIGLLSLCAILLLGLRGARTSGNIQLLIALAVTGLVALLALSAELKPAELLPSVDSIRPAPLAAALGVMFWCFVGIEAFAHMGEEFRRPERDFPVALVIGTLIAGLVYWAGSAVTVKLHAYGTPALDAASVPHMVQQLFGGQYLWVASLLGFLSCFATVNIYLQGFSRLIWAQARHGRMPAILGETSTRGVPANALIAVCALSGLCLTIATLCALSLDDLIRYANGLFVLVYLVSMAAAVKLFTGPGRWLAAIATALSLAMYLILGPAALYSLGLVVLFSLIDLCRSRKKRYPQEAKLADS